MSRYRFTMSDDELTGLGEDRAWENARKIWLAAGVDLPDRMNNETAHYLADLKLVAAMYRSAEEVDRADRSRKIRPKDLAERCRALSSALSQIDNLTFARMNRGSSPSSVPDLDEMLDFLYRLEIIFASTKEPKVFRKRKHDLNDMAIPRLAEVFELATNSHASVTKHWEGSDRSGRFVDFVLEFYRVMLPEFEPTVSGRSIQASLEKRSGR